MIKLNKIIFIAFVTSAILISIERSQNIQAQSTITPYSDSINLVQRKNQLVQEVDTIGITVSDMNCPKVNKTISNQLFNQITNGI